MNHLKARVVDMLWFQNSLRGVVILPKQILWLGSWMSFPSGPNLIPIDFSDSPRLDIEDNNVIHLLLETELVPYLNANKDGTAALMVGFA